MWSEQSVWSENTGYVEHRRHRHHSGRQTVSRHTQAPFIAQAAVSYGSLTVCGWARAAWGPASAWTTCHSSHTWGSSPPCGWPCGTPGEPSGWKTCHTKYTCSSSDLHINPNDHTVNQSATSTLSVKRHIVQVCGRGRNETELTGNRNLTF